MIRASWPAVVLAIAAGCDDNDDVWSGGSGWLIGLLLGALLLVLLLGAWRKRGK